MKICFICEGSYPYVSGGVSNWVQMVIKAMPEIEFVIFAIATDREEMSEYKCEIPDNVKEIKTFYLGDKHFISGYGKVHLTESDKHALRNLVVDKAENINWLNVLEFIKKYNKKLVHLLMGEDFFELVLEIYQSEEKKTVFNEYLWSLRGMFYPLMSILGEDFPKADIYHAVSTGYAGIVGSVASFINAKPLLLSEHGIYTREREEDIIRSAWLDGDFKELWIDFFKKLSTISYQQAEIVTSLFAMNQTLQIELGCPKEKIRIIANGVEVEEFRSLKPVEHDESFHIGSVIRVVPIKDVKTMIMSFYIVKEQFPDAKLHILGSYDESPEYYYECLNLVEELHVKDVVFYGQVSIKEHLKKFDLLILTSISEGQPLAVLEGLAAGIPYICTNVGDCKGLIEGNEEDDFGKAGYIVPCMDAEALAEKILQCAMDRVRLKKMGENGQKRVEKYYQKRAFLVEYRGIYQELGGV